MKEQALTDEEIINALKKDDELYIENICTHCTLDVINLVQNNFEHVGIDIDRNENGMNELRIFINI